MASSRAERLAAARLYLCTDGRRDRGDLGAFLEEVLAGGVDVVQLREKGLEAREEIALSEVVADACRRHGALFATNDRADIARAVGADVLHLGEDDLPLPVARAVVEPGTLLGRSTHSLPSAAVGAAGYDYFCVGPCWPTPTKPGRPAPGLDLVRAVAATRPGRPWFAIGGIEAGRRLDAVLAAGASRVVVVRAVTEAPDPRAAAAALRAQLETVAGARA